jgi:hypothetical protein
VVALLDGREERVEVDVEDRPVWHGRYHRATVTADIAAVPSVVASLALLASMSLLGIAALDRFARHLDPLERFAYGAPIGMVVGTLALVPIASVTGFRVEVVVAVGLGCLFLAALVRYGRSAFGGALGLELASTWATWRSRPTGTPLVRALAARISLLPTVVLGAFIVRWAIFWRNAMTLRPDGLYAGHVALWGDWTVHLGIVSSFVYGANFPPEHPRFADHPFAYHYLSDLTAAAQVTFGMDPPSALALHSFVGCVFVLLGAYAFARRVTRDRRVATMAVVLFLLGSGLGWVATAAIAAQTGDLVGTLATQPWHFLYQGEMNLQLVTTFFGFIAPQRAFLYGLPIAFAVLSTLLAAVRGHRRRLFVIAGVIAGLLPLAHLGTLLALAIVTPFLFLLFPSRAWFWFFATWVAIAAPQLLLQLGGGAGALSAIRIQLGWVAAGDQWPWFWLKNLGAFAPLVVIALFGQRWLRPRAHRLLIALSALFVATNLIVFQPWDWDDSKLLVYWFLGVSIAAAAVLVRLWRRSPSVVLRIGLLAVVLTMTLSGLLEDLTTLEGHETFRMVGAQEIQLANAVRERTAPDALFIVGMENHDAIAMLTGRRIYVGYANWLWTEGIHYQDRVAEVEAIYRDEPGTDAVLAKRHIDYVVIGPHERDVLHADEAGFQARFPILVRIGPYAVYDVRGARS